MPVTPPASSETRLARYSTHLLVAMAILATVAGSTALAALVLSREAEERAGTCAETTAHLISGHVFALPEDALGRVLDIGIKSWPGLRYIVVQGSRGAETKAVFQRGKAEARRIREALEHARTGGTFEAERVVAATSAAHDHRIVAACAPEERPLRRLLLSLVLIGLCGIVGGVVLVEVMQRTAYKRLEIVRAAAERVSQGDLAERIADEGTDEIARVGRAVDIAAARLSRVVRRIANTSETLRRVARKIGDEATRVAKGAALQADAAQKTHEDTEALLEGLGTLAGQGRTVARDARTGADSAARLGELSNLVAKSVQDAQATVDEVAASITELAQSVGEVARRTAQMAQSTPTTSAAMAHLERAIEHVRMNAQAAAQDAARVASDAARGSTALRETLAGIERIYETSARVTEVTLALESQIAEVGSILSVINDLADRTNLLALNASIIAAQAGEHGRGFAVVASEIKDLARRTTQSVDEIGRLIESVQAGARGAREAVEQGSLAVDQGASQVREATALLSEILERVHASTRATQAIAAAANEQSRLSASVTSAVKDVGEAVRQIAVAVDEQANGARHIRDLTERLRQMIGQVGGATLEQREAAALLAELTGKVTEMVEGLSRLQENQSESGERIRAAMAAIRQVADEHRTTVDELGRAVEELGKHAGLLNAEIERFRVS